MKHLCASNFSLFGTRDPDNHQVDPGVLPVIIDKIISSSIKD